MFRRNRALRPGRGCAGAAIVDQHQALAFAVLEGERQPAVDFDDIAGRDGSLVQAIVPERQRVFAGNAQAGRRDAVGAARLRRHGPVEEGEVGTGARLAVGVEQMIGGDVVLVHRLLDEPHAEEASVEGEILRRPRRDGGEMVNSGQLHRV